MTRQRKLIKKIELRVSEFEKNRIKWLADRYANGNISLWVVYCALNAPRKEINFDEMEDSTRKRPSKRGP